VTPNIDRLKIILAEIAPQYGIDQVFLFGSQARGEAAPDSDVELVIELGEPLGFKRGRLCLEVESALGIPVDITFGRDNLLGPIREGFDNDAVMIYER
jgi:predicted nucleotidyltransferase